MEAIDHLDRVITSVERSLAFYRGLLEPLRYVHDLTRRVGELEARIGQLEGHGS